jgi:hypothetical protein
VPGRELSVDDMRAIGIGFPKLLSLKTNGIDLCVIEPGMFPALTSLDAAISLRSFQHIKSLRELTTLITQTRDRIVGYNKYRIKVVSQCTKLVNFSFEFMNTVSQRDILIEIGRDLDCLQELTISGTSLDGIQHLSTLTKLQTLDVSRCIPWQDKYADDYGLWPVLPSLKRLVIGPSMDSNIVSLSHASIVYTR